MLVSTSSLTKLLGLDLTYPQLTSTQSLKKTLRMAPDQSEQKHFSKSFMAHHQMKNTSYQFKYFQFAGANVQCVFIQPTVHLRYTNSSLPTQTFA